MSALIERKVFFTALVTASNQVFANSISEYLQIFDEAHGSDSNNNLKGSAKTDFLLERFGEGKFCYMGDAAADLPVWQVSKKIITVNAKISVRRQAEGLGKPIEHLETTVRSLRSYIKALRPHHWLKNILIFLPMLAAHQLDAVTAFNSLIAFITFSLVASSVYLFNDLIDLNMDRAHCASGCVRLHPAQFLLRMAAFWQSYCLGLEVFGDHA